MGAGRKLARYTTVGGKTYAPGEVPSKEHAELIDNPKVWEADEVADIAPDPVSDGDYAAADADALKTEIDRRNDGREADKKVSKSGGKDKLIEALKADDADSANPPA